MQNSFVFQFAFLNVRKQIILLRIVNKVLKLSSLCFGTDCDNIIDFELFPSEIKIIDQCLNVSDLICVEEIEVTRNI